MAVSVPILTESGEEILTESGQVIYTEGTGILYVDVATAIQMIVQAGLIPFVYYAASSTVPSGYVISQAPPAGTLVAPNTQIVITVSDGYSGGVGTATVPNVVGDLWFIATTALAQAYISCDKYLWVVSASAQGSVVAQSIAANTQVTPGTIVQLTLSAGEAIVETPVSVPNLQ